MLLLKTRKIVMNTKVKWATTAAALSEEMPKSFLIQDDYQPEYLSPPSVTLNFTSSDTEEYDAYFFLCKVKNKDSDWSVLHKGTSDEDFHKTLKQHCENHMNNGNYEGYVIHSYGISLDHNKIKTIPEHCYVQLKPKKKEPKVFLNGPKKNTEFLAKKGKHYVSSNNHPA